MVLGDPIDYRLAAAFCGRHPGVIRRWVHEGRLTRYGTPRRLLIDMRELGDEPHKEPPKRLGVREHGSREPR